MMNSRQAGMDSADAVTVSNEDSNESLETGSNSTSSDEFSMRENLHETVFFYPDLEIENGSASVNFRMNDALTKWNLLLLAHDKELRYSYDVKEIISQKELMIEPLLPRFVRQGDEIVFTAKVSNLTKKKIDAASQLILEDGLTGERLETLLTDASSKPVSIEPGSSEIVTWSITLPDSHINPLIVKTIVKGEGHSDGEQNTVPVLSNRMLITETQPMHLAGGETKTFHFDALEKLTESTSLEGHAYSMEFSSNPSWIVAKSIPFITTECDYLSTISIANSIYGNQLMQHLLEEQPSIKKAIASWKEEDLTSELELKQDLKLASLKETPWVRQAHSQSEQMRKLKVFLDGNFVNQEIASALNKLKKRQLSNGGFTWMQGGRDNLYVTQNVLETIGHLKELGIEISIDEGMIKNAIRYIDARMLDLYKDRDRLDKDRKHLYPEVIQYLYVRSFFDYPISKALRKAIDFYFKKGDQYWTEHNSYQQALLALAAHRSNRNELAMNILSSLEDRMIRNDELGNYWNDQAGFYWYNLNIEKQALMIELFKELKPNSNDVAGLKLHLLKKKQTNSWKTGKATAAACYAFLLGSDSWLDETVPVVIQNSILEEKANQEKSMLSTGYSRIDIAGELLSTDLAEVKIFNPNKGVAWGASYFQYFEDLDKIETFEDTPATLGKKVFKVGMDKNGQVLKPISETDPVHPGDRLRIQIFLTLDRPMEFMALKDMRSSGLEPVNVLSQYKWQDGLGYYESTKDLATYFFFDRIPKGNYVFEYDVFAVHQGRFSNGIAEFQSMYAPEFSSHSEGVRLEITKP